uniref:Uncharacterized protein n=1 Tax=Anguilla anguilla TaxID=7936 RepID=A0A0E9XMK2_ANGAN
MYEAPTRCMESTGSSALWMIMANFTWMIMTWLKWMIMTSNCMHNLFNMYNHGQFNSMIFFKY